MPRGPRDFGQVSIKICADQEIFVKGWGCSSLMTMCFFFKFSHQLILQSESNCVFPGKHKFYVCVCGGGPNFPGGGVLMLHLMETYTALVIFLRSPPPPPSESVHIRGYLFRV